MNPEPYFSIVIPCLNEAKSLPNLLKDISQQTFSNFEVFVVDGKSEDDTRNIVREASDTDSRLHLIVSEKRNVGHQRNLGGQAAQGEYILFLDADDRIPSYYLAGLQFLCAKDGIDGFTTYATVDTDNTNDKMFIRLTNGLFDAAAKMNTPFSYGACIGCKRKVFAKLKGFNEKVTFGEDTEFVRRLAKKGFKFVVFKEPTYTYSMRRFQKEGTLRLVRKMAPTGLKMLLNKKHQTPIDAYPMLGGTYFDEVSKKKRKKGTIFQLERLADTLKMLMKE